MRKIKSVSIILTVIATAFIISGCSSDDSDKDSLTIYTARSEPLNNTVIPAFEEETGIDVDIVTAGTGELLKRVKSEKNNPQGDILWAADETMLSSEKEYFEK